MDEAYREKPSKAPKEEPLPEISVLASALAAVCSKISKSTETQAMSP